MARRLVLLRVADRAEGVLHLERELAQRRRGEGERGRRVEAPLRRPGIAAAGGVLEQQRRGLERHQSVRELVLDGLEAADRLAELAPRPGMFDREIEGATHRAECTGHQREPQVPHGIRERTDGSGTCSAGVAARSTRDERRQAEARLRPARRARCVARVDREASSATATSRCVAASAPSTPASAPSSRPASWRAPGGGIAVARAEGER
ncbi:MAG: hypothetical protein U1F11_10180 [Steroidobacteraceae bacterium]